MVKFLVFSFCRVTKADVVVRDWFGTNPLFCMFLIFKDVLKEDISKYKKRKGE